MLIDFHCLRIVLMDEVLGQRPSTAPHPILTASIPEHTPGPSDQEEDDDDDMEEESQPGPRRLQRGWRGSSLLQRTIITLFLLLFS